MMKKLLPLFILLCAGLAAAQSLQEKIAKFPDAKKYSVTYDKFTDRTTVSVAFNADPTKASQSKAGGVQVVAYFGFKGQTVAATDKFYLAFRGTCAAWCFLDDHALTILAGSERIALGQGKHKGVVNQEYKRVSTTETMIYSITQAQMEAVAGAASAEFRLGNFEGFLDASDRSYISNLLKLSAK